MAFDYNAQLELLRKSKLLHGKWYERQYLDVPLLPIDSAEHYLKYGAKLGRNPGKYFDTSFYIKSYPDVSESGLNPLVHYILHGEKEGRLKTKKSVIDKAKNEVRKLRKKLLSLGFVEKAVADLEENLEKNSYLRSLSAKELAQWHMRAGTGSAFEESLRYIGLAKEIKLNKSYRAELAVLELLCLYHLGELKKASEVYDVFNAGDGFFPDVELAYSNFKSRSADKISAINKVLSSYGIRGVSLKDNMQSHAYDSLNVNADEMDVRSNGPLISILIATYNAESTIATTISSLQSQSYKNLEVLILDDCSTDNTRHVVSQYIENDHRIRLVTMDVNGGAYVARNKGLNIATGEFVTIHDADDWSHPDKLKSQVEYLLKNPDIIGCTSQQARADNSLRFLRWTGNGKFIITNTSSFMFRREPVITHLGGWDTVRFSADNEFIRRIQVFFGKSSVVHLPTGPLSFQRDSDTSVVAHEFFGINGAHFGVRKEYLEAQEHHHSKASSLKYNGYGSTRPFYAPRSMRGKSTLGPSEIIHYEVIIASDFRMPGGSVISCVEEIKANKRAGVKTAIFQMYRYDLGTDGKVLPEIRELIDGDMVEMLTYGECASCDLLLIRYPPVLQHFQKYIPTVKADNIKVIVNQPPMSDYSASGVMRYDFESCSKNTVRMFGKPAVWHPIGPLVRNKIYSNHRLELHHVELSEFDWTNIIDVDSWLVGQKDPKGEKLVIGRHSRDHLVKWPSTKEDILTVYPDRDDIEVLILGGASAAISLLEYVPSNWRIYNFGEIHPKEFLQRLDVFIYFTHPDWVESFGRVILEAMASGIPVILPHVYFPLFGAAAVYADEKHAVSIALELFNDKLKYNAQVEAGLEFARSCHSYETHSLRVRDLLSK